MLAQRVEYNRLIITIVEIVIIYMIILTSWENEGFYYESF